MKNLQSNRSLSDLLAEFGITQRQPNPESRPAYYFDGLAVNLAPATPPDSVLPIIERYTGCPRIHLWNHPKASEYSIPSDTIFISDPTIHREHITTCTCEACKLELKISDEEMTSRFYLHELAHSTGAKKRLNRMSVRFASFGPLSVIEEIIAETTASRIASKIGVQTPAGAKMSNEYIKGYVNLYERETNEKYQATALRDWAEPHVEQAIQFLLGGSLRFKGKTRMTPVNAFSGKTKRALKVA